MMGAGMPRITLAASYTHTQSEVTPTDATVSFTLESDGDIVVDDDFGSSLDIGDWIDPKGAAGGAYECRMSTVSGTVSTGTVGSWLALSSSRGWSKTRTSDAAGTDTYVGTLEIRRTADAVVLDSATVTLNATVEP
jgi:hypothetical protein